MIKVMALAVVCLAIGVSGCQFDGDNALDVESDPYKSATIRKTPFRPWFESKSSRRSGPVFDGGAAHDALSRTEYYATDPAGARQTAAVGQAAETDAGDIVFNFADAQISEVVDIVLGDLLQENYSIDPQIRGSITMRTSQPLSRESVLPTLQNLLALNGVSLVKVDELWQVLPFSKALKTPSVVVGPNNRDVLQGQAIHVIPLEYVSAASALEVVHGQINPGRQLIAIPDQNLFLFIGPAFEARILESLIAVLDVDQLAGKRFALVPIEVAPVAEVLENLEAVLSSRQSQQIQFLPIERLSAILIISRKKTHIRRAVKWIARLDRADTESVRQIHVYHVRNGKAGELAAILGDLFSSAKAGSLSDRGRDVAPGLQPVSANVEDDGSENQTGPAAQPARQYGSADDDNGLKIIADERNNALVIRATPAEYQYIEATLARLDIMPLQVFIEVTVAEVSLKGDLEFGIEWYLSSGQLSGTFSTSPLGIVANAFPGFGFSFSGSSAKIILNALDEITDVEVISSPKIMVLDNQSARLQVGDQVPVVSQTTESLNDSESVVVKSIKNVDTGIILEVKPTVNTGGLVTLNVMQEVSEATQTSTSGIDSPSFQTRRIESKLAVQSGETVALGGLIRDRTSIGKIQVPVASRIPVVGNLFQSKSRSKGRTELIILITPHVSRDPAEARALTYELRAKISTLGSTKF